jgi:hypothetical protein
VATAPHRTAAWSAGALRTDELSRPRVSRPLDERLDADFHETFPSVGAAFRVRRDRPCVNLETGPSDDYTNER